MSVVTVKPPPIIDFGPFYGNNIEAKRKLIEEVRAACLAKGFFQITNHPIPKDLQDQVFSQCKEFFSLPLEEKMKSDKGRSISIIFQIHRNSISQLEILTIEVMKLSVRRILKEVLKET